MRCFLEILSPFVYLNLNAGTSICIKILKCSLESSTNDDKSIKLLECRKCAALEQQLHQALNELSSAQLIIELFNKEHSQGYVCISAGMY